MCRAAPASVNNNRPTIGETNTNADEQISLSAAAQLPELRIDGKAPDRVTLYRWASSGCRGVMLEITEIGTRLCTNREAVRRFLNALNRRRAATAGGSATAHRQREHRRAERALEAAGI